MLKLPVMGGLLLLGMLCLAAHAAEEDPKPETVSASSVNVTALPADWGPDARDDLYTFNGTAGQFIQRNLWVLKNDWPGIPHIKIIEIMSFGAVGTLLKKDNYLVYTLASYDGREVTDSFGYRVASSIDDTKTDTAQVAVEISPALAPFVPKSDEYTFAVPNSQDATPGTETKTLDVLANDIGSNLMIVELDTRLPMTGRAAVAPDQKSITYTYSPSAVKTQANDRFWYFVTQQGGMTRKKARVVVRLQAQKNPVLYCGADRYSISAQPGEAISRVLDVLSNDGNAVGELRVISVEADPPGSTLKGTVQHLDQQGVKYTVTYQGMPFTDEFKYVAQDEAGQTCKVSAKVDVGLVPIVANPDRYSFYLDSYGNLPLTRLDVLANDADSGIKVIDVKQGGPGYVSWTSDALWLRVDSLQAAKLHQDHHIHDLRQCRSSCNSICDY